MNKKEKQKIVSELVDVLVENNLSYCEAQKVLQMAKGQLDEHTKLQKPPKENTFSDCVSSLLPCEKTFILQGKIDCQSLHNQLVNTIHDIYGAKK